MKNSSDSLVNSDLLEQQAPIDVFGVGINLVTGYPDAALDGVYKLVFSNGEPRIKLSENLSKITLPHRKQVFRILDNDDNFSGADAVTLSQEEDPVIMYHPLYPLIVATQDWHPQNHVSFASNHPDEPPFNKINIHGVDQVLWPDHCVQGTPGAMFHPDLETNRFSAIFRKGMNPYVDSYSGFYDNIHQVSTGLSGYLKEKGVTELYFCGLAGDICVYHTITDAIKEGFSSTLIEDASRPLSQETFAFIKIELANKGVCIIIKQNYISDCFFN